MQTIAIANQKGGVGKTTTALTLGAILAEHGQRVLLLDLDPQCSLTQSLGYHAMGESIAEVIGGAEPGALTINRINRKITERLTLAPGDLALAGCELALIARFGRELVIKNALAWEADSYDVTLIDCPPSLSLLTVNALVAAHGVLVPTLPAAMDLRGLRLFMATLDKVKQLNPTLQVVGIVVTQYDSRLTAHQQALLTLQTSGLPVLESLIPRSVKVQESSGAKQPITQYDPLNKAAAAYYGLAAEVEAWLKRNQT